MPTDVEDAVHADLTNERQQPTLELCGRRHAPQLNAERTEKAAVDRVAQAHTEHFIPRYWSGLSAPGWRGSPGSTARSLYRVASAYCRWCFDATHPGGFRGADDSRRAAARHENLKLRQRDTQRSKGQLRPALIARPTCVSVPLT
jgi:hypothetical protein